jgi:outer membrane protein OmpA-like peptidoglycan-associated protein
MKTKNIIISLVIFSGLFISRLNAQDAEGCKDHQFFTRMTNFMIESCRQNFDSYGFLIGPEEKKSEQEGNLTAIIYVFNEESGGKMPSTLEIIKNYENAIIKNGGKKIYSNKDEGATFTMSRNNIDYWVFVGGFYTPTGTGIGKFELVVVEKTAMNQSVQASEMFNEISKSGHIALYINFDTGKSTIKPESDKIIDELVKMMKANPSLKVSVEGHTDNAGNAASNKTLSESRAKAVVDKLIASGIDKTRLSSKGWGQEKPVSDNGTEEGKAKNRRVAIVKM